MNSFNIEFTKVDAISGSGVITIGDFSERFEADLSHWSPNDYVTQWKGAIQQLPHTRRAALITSIGAPGSNFIRCWAMYLDGTTVVFQEQILFPASTDSAFDPQRTERYVSDRGTSAEDGSPISEWACALSDVGDFAAPAAPTSSDTSASVELTRVRLFWSGRRREQFRSLDEGEVGAARRQRGQRRGDVAVGIA